MTIRATTVLMLSLLSQFMVGPLPSHAQENALPEYQAKALFLYNFAKFIEWPAGKFATTNTPLVFGVFSPNPFGPHLEEAVRNKTVNGRTIEIRQLNEISETHLCHLVFVSAADRLRLDELFKLAESANVLTVGESKAFFDAGGIINFYLATAGPGGNRIRFEINDHAARRANLRISSKLLNLGRRVPAGAAQ